MSQESDDTGWWERVFSVKEERELLNDCDRECFTFACRCRQEALAQVTRETGVSYATDEECL